MQKEIILNLTNLEKSGLYLNEYVMLKLIYENINVYKLNVENVEEVLEELQKDMWIKILDDEEIEPRAKTIELFDVNSELEKNIDEVLLYLNKVTGRGFKIETKGNRKFPSARLKEGYTVEEMKKVVNIMYEQWNGTQWEDYLRPQTLFNGEKMPGYMIKANKVSQEVDYITRA